MKTTTTDTLKTLSVRVAAALGFLVTLLSMNFICNGINLDVKSALTSVKKATEVVRRPAMMRVNPIVHDLDEKEEVNRFRLATRKNDFSKGADGRGVSAVRELARDYSMIIPATLSPVSDAGALSMQIVDHSINAFFNQASIKNTFVGRAAETFEKKLKTEVELGGSKPNSVKHNIKFQVKATESKASMEYRGLTNCDFSYSVASQKANFEIFEPLNKHSNIVFTHSDAPSDRRDVLSLQMHW